jgi:hypothetical protein
MARSKFENDYKVAINNILREIYGNTQYWGVGAAGNGGIIRPLNDNDDPKWSNYNFINTHYTVRDKIVIPYLKNIGDFAIDPNKNYQEDDGNRNFFRLLYQERNNIFGPNSPLKNDIINTINKTRGSGTKRENFVKVALESVPNTSVEMVSEAGGSSDFAGIDMIVDSSVLPKKKSTAQVKPFINLSKGKKYWYISTDALRRDYNTDLLIFGKSSGQEYHVAVFENQPKRFIFESDRVIIPIDLCKLLINYNAITGKSVVKNY